MEHDVFVPVPSARLREALADPARVARAVPGLQQDTGAEPVSGRLKVRVGSHSVTYRGTLRITARDDGAYAVEGDATETRGTGSVKLALTLRVTEAEGGSKLAFEGTASADGRVTELPADAVGSAVTRLLNRFAENLAATDESEQPEPPATQTSEAGATDDFETTPDADDEPAPGPVSRPASVFDTEVPPPSLDPVAETDDDEDTGDTGDEAAADAPEDFPEPPAEAAHARRTMIGRSAEEVDHAPPRGRYAPVPAPQTVSPGSPLRWAAPAAAVVLASAIVVGRALRRRR
ncbi:SRPBCC domain-containing protein [Streptomyces gilvus]|uniref:SRPBCC domain-containing protein n=1 Tax=Streptomyces gilvus TaxID=2920937 RepID=UPI001F0E9B47|nr:SRPBCC domain-containing protein [Streptomyces sp. CME 23]MCH5674904.1 SRPBCC family protein [Streptomyces sp. CME 23]